MNLGKKTKPEIHPEGVHPYLKMQEYRIEVVLDAIHKYKLLKRDSIFHHQVLGTIREGLFAQVMWRHAFE